MWNVIGSSFKPGGLCFAFPLALGLFFIHWLWAYVYQRQGKLTKARTVRRIGHVITFVVTVGYIIIWSLLFLKAAFKL